MAPSASSGGPRPRRGARRGLSWRRALSGAAAWCGLLALWPALAAAPGRRGFVAAGPRAAAGGGLWLGARPGPARHAGVLRRIDLGGGEGSGGENRTIALPAPGEACSEGRPLEASDGKSVQKAQIQLPLNDKFGLAYTCCKCNTRNAIEVTRIAWDKGVVVATCRGCKARHLLADSGGLLDLTNELNFRNVVDFMQSKGQDVLMLDKLDEEALGELNLRLDEKGKLAVLNSTVPESGSVAEWAPEGGGSPAAGAPAADAAPAAGAGQAGAAAAPSAPEPQLPVVEEEEVDAAPIVVQLPVDVKPKEGDTLTLRTEFGILHVPVPGEAAAGSRLEVQGMVEVSLPQKGMARWVQAGGAGEWQQKESWEVGDIVAVNMPEGKVARVQIREDSMKDGLVRIGYPVAALPMQA